ncbi:Hint domain-containing protein, partial [Streptomyces zhihengii]
YTGQHKSDTTCTSCNTQTVRHFNPDEIFPGVFVPAKWKGRKAFIERFYSNYLDGARGNNGWLPGYLTDGTNPEAARQQLGYWALNVCREMKSCPQSLTNSFRRMQMGFGESVSAIAGSSHDGSGVGSNFSEPGSEFSKSTTREILGGSCSFSPDTSVLMENGKKKQIGEIEPGDKVESADPGTGKHRGVRRVSATLVHHDDDLVDLKVLGKSGELGTLHTTSLHPFWDSTERAWVPAGRLILGHKLATASNGSVAVISVESVPGAADMFNLTVGQLHTFYVLAGRTPVLVHNSMDKCSDAAFQTVLHNEQEIIEGNSSHIIPGMDSRTPEGADALAEYVDNITSTPGTPLSNGRGEAWYDSQRGLYIYRGGTPEIPSGSVFRATPDYFTSKTGVQIKK